MSKQEIFYKCVERCLQMGYDFTLGCQDVADPDDTETNFGLKLSVGGYAYSSGGNVWHYPGLNELVADFVSLIRTLEESNE
jgi:hypothetical protein